MRLALTLATTAAMLVLTSASVLAADNESAKAPVKRMCERPRLTGDEIHNPIVKRIDSLTWDDQEIIDALKTMPEKAQAKFRPGSEARSKPVPYGIRNIIKLKYRTEGGAVLPMSTEPTPWIHAGLQPIVSLGLMPCHNSMDKAKAIAKETGKPILVIYTELPGCGACVGHGYNQLSHPFVIDAALEFVPVVVSGGWPHLWVLDPEGKPISERVNHKTSIGDTLKMMRNSLRTAQREVPAWLELVTDEYTAERETTAFAMGCFWSGERKLGSIDGVLSTRVGSRQGRGEWVEVEFDPDVIGYEELVKAASEMKCTSAIVARTDKQAEIAKDYVSQPERLYRDDQSLINLPKNPSADKHSIYNSKRYGNLPMTPGQATRINAHGKNAEKYLSPSQLIFLKKMEELIANGAEVGDFPKPDWTSLESLENDVRALQTKLGMCPERAW